MQNTALATNAIAVALHHLADQSALAVMREGAMRSRRWRPPRYHRRGLSDMNGIGCVAIWLIVPPDGHDDPIQIDACGPATRDASIDAYRARGLSAIQMRGPLAANTVAGTVGGWRLALEMRSRMGGHLPLRRLLADAIGYARDGLAITLSQGKHPDQVR